LVVGLGKTRGEFFVSSDVTGFLEYSKAAVFLEEGDMVIIDNGNSIDAGADTDYKMKLFNINTDCVVKRPVTKLDWDAQQAQKGKFEHFYLKEVMEQAEAMEKLTKMDTCLIEEMACEIKDAKEVYMVACGTASYTCMHALYIFSKICNVHLNFCAASEFYHFKNFVSEKSVVFAVSQSGETADTLSAIRIAKEKGAKVLSITNVMGSSLMRESDKCILQNVGPEIAVNSTKAYTSQLAILTLLAYAVDGRINEGIEEMKELPRHIYYLTSENARKSTLKLAEKLMDNEHLFVIGRGLQYPTALEAAHKIKEVSYIHTEAFAGGELKHGANALITKGTPYIVFSSDETEKEIISNAMEVKSRGAFVIGVGPKRNDVFDVFVKVPETGVFNPIVQIIPLQIVAYQLAVLRGCDPDFPRNLAKSVTVK
ncbi:MAG: isomerizing glutamine--fructose-6-phosphate transaminase, partial [Candidatus Diapherotrites archaeon]|nr:isomerizing glutamine--fructose-6-phosphate transaminase [Candidatus Diapherotrites archaeon]